MTHQRKNNTSAVVCLLLAAGVLAGCSSQVTTAPVNWVEPGWMTQVRADIEEYQVQTLACLRRNGLDGSVSVGGMVSIDTPRDEYGREDPDLLALTWEIGGKCHEEVG